MDSSQEAFGREVRAILAASKPADRAAVEAEIGRLLGHQKAAPRAAPLSPRDEFVRQVFLRSMEIVTCSDSLKNIQKYPARFPYRHAGVSKASYLRYHIENYLEELCVTRERMLGLLTFIERRYRRTPAFTGMAKPIRVLRELVFESFSKIARVRGLHTHLSRFEDDAIARLSLFDALSTTGPEYAALFEWHYRDVRKLKLAWIAENNTAFARLLDIYFQALYSLLFDDTGTLQPPLPAA